MAKKKDRAFFVCPRWEEVVREAGPGGASSAVRVHARILAAIKDGRPVARSTLRKALVAVRQASGSMFDVDAYIVDQRVQSR
jgi:hypothetical protein